MLFTNMDYRKIICPACEKFNTEECQYNIESTNGVDFGGTMKCTDFEYKEGKTK